MSDSNDSLMSTLIESNRDTNAALKHLTNSINELIIDNKVRAEKDKRQDEANKKVDDFMERSLPVINRSIRTQSTFDKALVPLIVSFIIAVGTAIKFLPTV